MCVVFTTRVLPSHAPVEDPIHVCGASAGGCGRPSTQIVRSCPHSLTYWLKATMRPVLPSRCALMRSWWDR